MLAALFQYLETTLAFARIYPNALPQNPTLPVATYQLVDTVRRPTLKHGDVLPEARVQIDVWALNFSQANELAENIRNALDGYRGTMGDSPGVDVARIVADTDRTFYESEPKLHRVSRDFRITYYED